ncbi:branched-chain amino acid transporter AzlC [Helicobacter monodelphidis]|uniref:AzlC family ABC transporter permease n=1 Tax=Helicobacter sp. 15-1451 TaxID=2004995 RepID=UPI000DCD9B99|nr:AzlC family ABC transporter permease [Helicobacter sp. 15-1451]RAX57882.1 branched-chain amino acid transporter AzlC [Helicobacter sp. 15-1451]
MNLSIFLKTIPVLMGYIPLGAAYGILFATTLEYEWYYGVLIAIFVYAGAGQFLLVSLLATKAGYLEIAFYTFLLNFRHIFYGISLLQDVKNFSFWKKHIIIFCLTDETYAIIKNSDFSPEERERSFFWVAILDYLYWILGSTIGIFIGKSMDFGWEGVEFSLSALFVVLTLSLLLKTSNKLPFYVASIVGCAGIFLLPNQHILLYSIFITIIILLSIEYFRKNAK